MRLQCVQKHPPLPPAVRPGRRHPGRRRRTGRVHDSRCANTQGTLRHTIDNRMVSGQSSRASPKRVAVHGSLAETSSRRSRPQRKPMTRSRRPSTMRSDDWDSYFSGEMTRGAGAPRRDRAAARFRLRQDRQAAQELESGDIADLVAWRNETLRPALADGASNLKKPIAIQLTADLDLDAARRTTGCRRATASCCCPARAARGPAGLDHHWRRDEKLGADPGCPPKVAAASHRATCSSTFRPASTTTSA